MDIWANQTNINSYSQETTVIQASASQKVAQQNISTENFTDIAMFSRQSLMQSKADELLDKLDSVYLSHVSAKDKKSLEKAYAQLDEIFQSEQTTPTQDRQADKLFEKIGDIFIQAESTLTDNDKQRIDTLNQKIDQLFYGADAEQFDDISDQTLATLEPLEQALDDVLYSTLTAQQKKELNGLHQQIGQLFNLNEHTVKDDKTITAAFDKIDAILNKSFEALSDTDKQRVQILEGQIDNVFNTINQQKISSMGYYSV